MLFATSTNVTVYAKYTSSGVGKTGITVKVAVQGPSGNIITVASSTNATEVDSTNAPGLYSYTISSANDATEGAYNVHFYTTDTTVDQKQFGVLIYCYNWVGYINGAGGNLNKAANTVSLSGTATTGSGTTITLTGGIATDDIYVGQTVYILSGTGAGQSRVIKQYVGATKVATVAQSWVTAPSNDSVFVVLVTGRTYVATIADNAITTASINDSALTAAKIATDAITSAKIADSAITNAKIADSALSAVKIADDAITAAKIANNAIDSTAIADNAITETKVSTGFRDQNKSDIWSYTSRALTDKDGFTLTSGERTNIATTFYSFLNTAVTTVGSWPKLLYDAVVSIKAKTDTISSGTYNSVSPFPPDSLVISLRPGDDYLAADGRAFERTIAGMPDFTGGTAKFYSKKITGGRWELDVDILSSDTISIGFPSSESVNVINGGNYEVKVTLANGSVITVLEGTTVRDV